MDLAVIILSFPAQCCPLFGSGERKVSDFAVLLGFVLIFALWQAVKWTRATWKTEESDTAGRFAKVGIIVVLSGATLALAGTQVVALVGDYAGDAAGVSTTTRGIPKLVDLGSKTCIPCQQMAPILSELTREYEGVFDVEFIDVGLRENQALAEHYGIRGIPTQIFFDARGNELWRHEGFMSKADILARWRQLGLNFDTGSETSERNSDTPVGAAEDEDFVELQH